MNAGELVVSLLLKAGDFKAQVQAAQKGLDGVQAAAVDAGRDVSNAAKRGGRGLDNLGSAARSAGKELKEAGNRGALSFERLKGTLTKIFGVIGGVAFIKSQFTAFTDVALEVDTASKTLGMDIKEFQGWQKAAEKVGLETQDLVQLFGDVSDRCMTLFYTMQARSKTPLRILEFHSRVSKKGPLLPRICFCSLPEL